MKLIMILYPFPAMSYLSLSADMFTYLIVIEIIKEIMNHKLFFTKLSFER